MHSNRYCRDSIAKKYSIWRKNSHGTSRARLESLGLCIVKVTMSQYRRKDKVKTPNKCRIMRLFNFLLLLMAWKSWALVRHCSCDFSANAIAVVDVRHFTVDILFCFFFFGTMSRTKKCRTWFVDLSNFFGLSGALNLHGRSRTTILFTDDKY